ncbi:MAG: hypothetical protein CBCREVIR_3347, partial [Candidatus Burkholderia crenata]
PRIASIAKDYEHDIHNACSSNPAYTGPNFNSLLGVQTLDSQHGRPNMQKPGQALIETCSPSRINAQRPLS